MTSIQDLLERIADLSMIIERLVELGRECANDYEHPENDNWYHWETRGREALCQLTSGHVMTANTDGIY